MTTARQLLRDLADAKVPLDHVVADFRTRVWPPVYRFTELEIYGVHDPPLPGDDSVDWIEITAGLTRSQRDALRAAYVEAVR